MELMKKGDTLFHEISLLIEQSRNAIYKQARVASIVLYWNIGKRINNDILENKRADYGKQIVSALATQLADNYGRSFELRNLRRMMQFSEQFSDFEIVSPSATQLSWSHIIEILPLKTQEAKLYYLEEAARGLISAKSLRELISRKAYERKEIANTQITDTKRIPLNTFRDPYLFDILGLKDEYQESDLEAAVLRELEKFVLEFGKGFAFVERQKRMIIGVC
jgi:predicted nuclease of restriction endonuclease-like (RecB) superfamily